MVLSGRIKAPGYIDALRTDNRWDLLGAWRSCSWRGLPKSNVDGLKQAKELEILTAHGWMTNDQVANEYFDNDYYANLSAIKDENAQREKNGLAPVGIVGDSSDAMEE